MLFSLEFEKESLVATDISISEQEYLFSPVEMINYNDDYLIISERLNSDYIKIWKLPEVEFMYSWGDIGGGPEEFLNIPMYLQTYTDNLIVHDVLARKVRYYNVTDSTLLLIKSSSLTYENQIDPLSKPVLLSPETFVVDYGTGFENTEYEHIIVKTDNDKPLGYFGSYPESELQSFDRYFEFSKTGIARPDLERYATFYNNYNRFKIYNRSGVLLKDMVVEDPVLSEMDDHNPADYRYFLYRSPVWASNDYIYSLGFNGYSDDLFEGANISTKTSLEIWDWDGNPVYRAAFDRYIRDFTVSEKHNKIYAYGFNTETSLFIYDLPQLD